MELGSGVMIVTAEDEEAWLAAMPILESGNSDTQTEVAIPKSSAAHEQE
jgi:hypothetical protein